MNQTESEKQTNIKNDTTKSTEIILNSDTSEVPKEISDTIISVTAEPGDGFGDLSDKLTTTYKNLGFKVCKKCQKLIVEKTKEVLPYEKAKKAKIKEGDRLFVLKTDLEKQSVKINGETESLIDVNRKAAADKAAADKAAADKAAADKAAADKAAADKAAADKAAADKAAADKAAADKAAADKAAADKAEQEKIDSLLNIKNEFWVSEELNWIIADLEYSKTKFVEDNFGPGIPRNFNIIDKTIYKYEIESKLSVSEAKEINSLIEKMKKDYTELKRQGYKMKENCDCDVTNSEVKEIYLINFNNKGEIKDERQSKKLYKKSE
jgi:chemotaxis protein histidine kinase CheA